MIGQALSILGDALRDGALMFWNTVWALVLGFALSGMVQAFVPRDRLRRVLGRPGAGTLAKAGVLGAVSSSCSYAATAMAKSLFAKGADFGAAMVFMIASTNLVIELGIVIIVLLGWTFALSELIGGILMIAALGIVGRHVFPPRLVDAARRRLQARTEAAHPAADENLPAHWRERMRSRSGWADAATYAVADLTMLRKEMAIGFGVAGLLSAAVPASVWGALFVSGHGMWSSIENAFIGPFIAIISFVCSEGNVPLAVSLWHGGISFGGVVSFIFADLITLPLLLIYRKYYGWKLTLRILASFWVTMALAGLAVEATFTALHLVPTSRGQGVAGMSFAVDVTSGLNVIALLVLVALALLSRTRQSSTLYAIDPICGMQVEIRSAPARATVQGITTYFCAEHCRDRFLRQQSGDGGGVPAPRSPTLHMLPLAKSTEAEPGSGESHGHP